MSDLINDFVMVGAVLAVYVVGLIGVSVAAVALLLKVQEWRQ